MFKNIGKKIKTLAKIFCWLGIIGSVIGGCIMIAAGATSGYSGSGVLVVIGICTIVFGSLISWVSTFMLYGFGELVDKTAEIAANTANTNNQIEY